MSNTVVDTRTCASSLAKGLRLLSYFSRQRPEWGVSELSAELGTAKSTVSRIARTLEAEGFLARAPNSDRFRLGLKLWSLGAQVLADDTEFPHLARRYLEEIVLDLNESAQAVILDGDEAVYVETVAPARSIRTHSAIGPPHPSVRTANGRRL